LLYRWWPRGDNNDMPVPPNIRWVMNWRLPPLPPPNKRLLNHRTSKPATRGREIKAKSSLFTNLLKVYQIRGMSDRCKDQINIIWYEIVCSIPTKTRPIIENWFVNTVYRWRLTVWLFSSWLGTELPARRRSHQQRVSEIRKTQL